MAEDTGGDDAAADSGDDTADGVDSCALISCDDHATCVNGSCVCDPGFEDDGSGGCAAAPPHDPDVNGDGRLDILVLGTEQSIRRFNGEFSTSRIASELQAILEGDSAHGLTINVVAEDIHLVERGVSVGLGQNGTAFSFDFHGHSLAQYYHWPAGRDARRANLRGEGGTDWDQVIIAADPYIVANAPGFYTVGVNEVADSVRIGGADPAC